MLSNHPLIQGLLVMICDKVQRLDRGIQSMKGLRLTDYERSLVSEAGVSLSMAGCNKGLLKEFAMLHQKPRIALDSLSQTGGISESFGELSKTA